jgi:phage gp29-like protein
MATQTLLTTTQARAVRKRAPREDAAPPLGEFAFVERMAKLRSLLFRDIEVMEGTETIGGVALLLNPDPVVKAEGGDLDSGIYDAMLDWNGHVEGKIDSRIAALLSREWDIEPGGDKPEHEERAAFVRWAFEQIPAFAEARRGMMDSVLKGFSATEPVWDVVDGNLIPTRLKDIDQRIVRFDVYWRPYLLTGADPRAVMPIHPAKILVQRHKAKSWNPYGVGVGRRVYWFHLYKKHAFHFWGTYCDKHAVPTAEAIYKSAGGSVNKAKALELAEQIARSEAVAHDDSVILQGIKDLARAGDVDAFDRLIERLNDEMAKSVTGEVLGSDAKPQGIGSGAADFQERVALDKTEYDAECHANTLSELARLIEVYNFPGPPPDGRYARFVVRMDPDEDRRTNVDVLDASQRLGLDVSESTGYEMLGITPPEPGEDLLEPPAPVVPMLGANGARRNGGGETGEAEGEGRTDTREAGRAGLRFGDPSDPYSAAIEAEQDELLDETTPYVIEHMDLLQREIARRVGVGKRSGSSSSAPVRSNGLPQGRSMPGSPPHWPRRSSRRRWSGAGMR